MLHNIVVVFLEIWKISWGVLQHRVLAKIVFHHLRHKIVDALVVCHTVADGVYQSHVACTVGLHDVWHTKQRRGLKGQRVHILVAYSAVDAAHSYFLLIHSTVIHLVVLHEEVARIGKCGTCLLREIGMFEESRVVAPRSEYHGYAAVVVHVVHHVAQQVGIVAVVCHGICGESVWRHLSRYLACYHRIACARRNPKVVLQHIPLSVLSLHEVDAGDV